MCIVPERCFSSLADIGIVPATCDYLYDYDTQTEYTCLIGDNSVVYVFLCHISTVEEFCITAVENSNKKMEPSKRDSLQRSCKFCSDSFGFLFTQKPWQTKIRNFWHHRGIHQYILRFKVQVNNMAFLMKIVQTSANSPNYLISHIPIKDWKVICRNRSSNRKKIVHTVKVP